MIAEFKEFIMRGNVLDLAVGVVIGSAFTAIVTGVVDGLITPFIGMVVGLLTGGGNLDSALSVLDVKSLKRPGKKSPLLLRRTIFVKFATCLPNRRKLRRNRSDALTS